MSTFRIAIIGPESTGKTRLAEQLAAHFNTVAVPEIARGWIAELGKPYQQEDLVELSRLQAEAEDKLLSKKPPLLICDTNQTVIRIWSLFKYGTVDPVITDNDACRQYELILLTDIDIPWEQDPLRENPRQRAELYSLYYRTLIASNRKFRIIFGQGDERLQRAVNIIRMMMESR
jgi:nicotinamide riboside kinase